MTTDDDAQSVSPPPPPPPAPLPADLRAWLDAEVTFTGQLGGQKRARRIERLAELLIVNGGIARVTMVDQVARANNAYGRRGLTQEEGAWLSSTGAVLFGVGLAISLAPLEAEVAEIQAAAAAALGA